MNRTEKLIIMFLIGFGLTSIEAIILYFSFKQPAIVSIFFFLVFSIFNGFIYTEAINIDNKRM